MALRLVTQDPRFAAAVSVTGVSDFGIFHFKTSIAELEVFFLPEGPLEPGGEYARRSRLPTSTRCSRRC